MARPSPAPATIPGRALESSGRRQIRLGPLGRGARRRTGLLDTAAGCGAVGARRLLLRGSPDGFSFPPGAGWCLSSVPREPPVDRPGGRNLGRDGERLDPGGGDGFWRVCGEGVPAVLVPRLSGRAPLVRGASLHSRASCGVSAGSRRLPSPPDTPGKGVAGRGKPPPSALCQRPSPVRTE